MQGFIDIYIRFIKAFWITNKPLRKWLDEINFSEIKISESLPYKIIKNINI